MSSTLTTSRQPWVSLPTSVSASVERSLLRSTLQCESALPCVAVRCFALPFFFRRRQLRTLADLFVLTAFSLAVQRQRGCRTIAQRTRHGQSRPTLLRPGSSRGEAAEAVAAAEAAPSEKCSQPH